MKPYALMFLPILALGAGCVSKSTYEAAVESANQARAADQAHAKSCQEQLAAFNGRLAQMQQQVENAEAKLAAQTSASQADVEQLRRQQEATAARAALFHDLAQKLAKMVDAGDLRIVLRDGRMVLQLPNDVLFDSGRTELKPAGRVALEKVATVLKTVHGHDFAVAGHTDNVPIETPQFPSNWELSTARALVVVHLLIAHGVDPTMLNAAGFGEFDPVASNDSPTGRAKNRRTELTLQPNIDEFVSVPALQ